MNKSTRVMRLRGLLPGLVIFTLLVAPQGGCSTSSNPNPTALTQAITAEDSPGNPPPSSDDGGIIIVAPLDNADAGTDDGPALRALAPADPGDGGEDMADGGSDAGGPPYYEEFKLPDGGGDRFLPQPIEAHAYGGQCAVDADCNSGKCINGQCGAPASCADDVWNGDESSKDCGGSVCAPCGEWRRCNTNDDCTQKVCVWKSWGLSYCLAQCGNGIKDTPAPPNQDGRESDIDCGGDFCLRCIDGRTCLEDADCKSNLCQNGTCVAQGNPSCSDGLKNGNETDLDCGGICASPGQGQWTRRCQTAQKCAVDIDCERDFCWKGTCTPAHTLCNDGAKNGYETDADCGGQASWGGACKRCTGGQKCSWYRDCDGGPCENGVCRAKKWCDGDGVKNDFETDVDCGGAASNIVTCGGCGVGKGCQVDWDCSSGTCTNGKCTPALHCSDAMQDGAPPPAAETDTDCGGVECTPCADGKKCLVNSDCQSGLCSNGVCITPPSCKNGLKDGQETDADCGGPQCPKCADGKKCSAPSDCSNGGCANGTCGNKTSGAFKLTAKGNATILRCGKLNGGNVDLPFPQVGLITPVIDLKFCFFVDGNGQYATGITGEAYGWDGQTRPFCNNMNNSPGQIGFYVAVDPAKPCG